MIPPRNNIRKILDLEERALDFAVNNGLLNRITFCCKDNTPLKKISEKKFKCSKKSCRKIYSIFNNTIFESMHLKFNEFLHIGYLWLAKATFNTIKTITGHSDHTITRILALIRNNVIENIELSDNKIGGKGIEVQLDESKFGKRKYNQGHHVEGAWIFGGVEVTKERKFFAVIVDKRDADTLNDLILKYVHPGSIVVTDGWKGYHKFKKNESFKHHWVNHKIGFKNSEGKHTNYIEGTWSGIKRIVPIRCRVKNKLKGHLFEFIWRRSNKINLWKAFIDLFK
jgi:transposase-like protein